MLKVVCSISSDITKLVQPFPPMHSQENAPKLQIWLVSLSQNTVQMRKINRTWPKYKQLKMQSGYICISNCKQFLPCILKKKCQKPEIWPVSLSQNDAKIRKIHRPWPKFIKFGKWSGYISMPKFRPFLPWVLQKMSGSCKFGLFH